MKRWNRAASAVALTLVAGTTGWVAPAASAAEAPVVVTDRGSVSGAVDRGVERFLGIPYAAAPTGRARWKAPRRAAAWEGVRDATRFGNACPVLPSSNGPRSETEDCLVLNVWRPEGTTAADRLPVHVFIHGGGLVNGSSAQNDESNLVRRTGVIGISLNYRLGALGFLRTPGLAAEDPDAGNYGFLDQQAALWWVKRNVDAFGGAPGQVTIDGESAGGWSVCGHLVSAGSRELFDRAMIQSGSCSSQTRSRAVERGAPFVEAAGCADATDPVRCLRRLPVGELLDASKGFGDAAAGRFVSRTPSFPEAPAEAVHNGDFARVPVLIGANRDEGRTFAAGFIGADEAAYRGFVEQVFGDRTSDVLEHYPWPAESDRFTAAYLVGAVQTDSGMIAGIGGCPNRRLTDRFARWTRTYAYEFSHRTGPGLTPVPGYVWGAGHAAELAYVWPSFDNGTPIAPLFDAGERQLSREMTEYWGAFARTGRPQVPGQTAWRQYGERGRTLVLRAGGRSRTIRDTAYDRRHQCDFWSTLAVDVTA